MPGGGVVGVEAAQPLVVVERHGVPAARVQDFDPSVAVAEECLGVHHPLRHERVDTARQREAVGAPEVLGGLLRGEAGLHRAVDELVVVGVARRASVRGDLQAVVLVVGGGSGAGEKGGVGKG